MREENMTGAMKATPTPTPAGYSISRHQSSGHCKTGWVGFLYLGIEGNEEFSLQRKHKERLSPRALPSHCGF